MKMLRTIRAKLIASYVLLTLLTVSAVGFLASSLVQRHATEQARSYLKANGETIAHQAAMLLHHRSHPLALQQLAYTTSFLINAEVRIFNQQGELVADSGPASPTGSSVWFASGSEVAEIDVDLHQRSSHRTMLVVSPQPSSEPLLLPVELPAGAMVTLMQRIDSPWGSQLIISEERPIPVGQPAIPSHAPPSTARVREPSVASGTLRVPIRQGQQEIGYVELRDSRNAGAEALATIRRAFFLAAGAATLLAILAGLAVSRGLTAPLAALARAADHMSGGDLSARAPVQDESEIGQLSRQFNRMAAQLESSFRALAAERDTLRRFIADASHELRTPITALKTFNELLLDRAAEDPTARAEFLIESRAQIERLEWITHNLLDLSRLEAGLVALEIAPHPVEELIETSVAPFKRLADSKGIALSLQLPNREIDLSCDPVRIGMVLSNLLDNALKFTPPGGQVQLGAGETTGGTIQLWVRDNGPGISPADLPHLFERFYRGRGSGEAGSGLGLAIAQGVVQAHGGRLRVESEPGAGSCFTIELPVIVSLPEETGEKKDGRRAYPDHRG